MPVEGDTVGNQDRSVGIVSAAALCLIKIAAAHLGVKNFATVFIFELMQTTFGTAITK